MANGENERIALFDNAKGLAIILVAVGHAIERSMTAHTSSHLAYATLAFIYFFHMPIFIFCSGLFAGRSWRKNKVAPIDKFVLYLALYLIFLLLILVLRLGTVGRIATFNPYAPAGTPWFLLTLATLMLLVPLLGHIRPVPLLICSVVAAVGAGLLLPSNSELSLLRTFTYLPYFAAGFYFTPERVQRCVMAVRRRLGAARAMIAAALVLAAIFVVLYVAFDDTTLQGIKWMSTAWNLIATVANSTGISKTVWTLFRILEYPFVIGMIALVFLALPQRHSYLTVVGERSLQVYIFHMLLIYAAADLGFFSAVMDNNPYWFACALLLGVGVPLLLALPKAPSTWVSALGAWCKRVCAPKEPPQSS